jgi:carboxypeptidase Taq
LRDVPEIAGAVERGDFAPLMQWLRRHVHGQGARLSAPDLLREATGEALNPAIFKAHLTARYLD